MKYNGIIKSDDINQAQEKTLERVITLSKEINKLSIERESYNLLTDIETIHIKSFINDFYNEKDKLAGIVPAKDMNIVSGAYKNIKDNYITKLFYKEDSKLKFEDVTPNDLFIEVVEDKRYINIIDYNLEDFIKGNLPWIREIEANGNEEEVITTFIITIPSSINYDIVSNFIEFDLIPFHSTRVLNVEYADIFDNRYLTTIENIKDHKGCTVNKYTLGEEGYGHIALNFDEVEIKKLAITVSQKTPTKEGVTKIFHMGLQNLNISRRSFKNELVEIDVPFKSTNINGDYILNVVPIISGVLEVSPIISVYRKIGSSNELLFEEFIPFQTTNEDYIFRITYPKSTNSLILKSLKFILK